MRREYDSSDGEYATAVAASAFAIHAREEKLRDLRIESGIPSSKVKTRRNEQSRPAAAAPSTRRPFGQENNDSSSLKSVHSTANPMRNRNAESKTDSWGKAELEKIRKRYEKMHSDILAWEKEKKAKVELQLEKKKIQLAHKRDRILQHYRVKIGQIDHIARGAKQQIDEKRKFEESVLKERTKKLRSTGKSPVCCYCF